MQDKYNNRQPMSGTWSTLGTLKPAYYNIFYLFITVMNVSLPQDQLIATISF